MTPFGKTERGALILKVNGDDDCDKPYALEDQLRDYQWSLSDWRNAIDMMPHDPYCQEGLRDLCSKTEKRIASLKRRIAKAKVSAV